MSQPLDARAAELLKLLVERYIHDGQPVGSRTLSRMTSLGMSSATIRNVMAYLAELGFVASPYSSDRKGVVYGKSGFIRVDFVCRRLRLKTNHIIILVSSKYTNAKSF